MSDKKDRTTWLALVALLIFGAGFVLALLISARPAPSAAATVRRTLLGLILAPVLLGGGFVALKSWWEQRARTRRFEETLMQARAYRSLQGEPAQPRRRRPSPREEPHTGHGPINILLPGDRTTYPRLDRRGEYE